MFNLPESEKEDVKERQTENSELLCHIMEVKMNTDLQEIEIQNPVRIGRRQIIKFNGKIVSKRSMRFTVKQFKSKRKILKANSYQRQTKDEIFNRIYFTPYVIKNQRDEAFKLREEKKDIELFLEKKI